jgi:hypothetical protein
VLVLTLNCDSARRKNSTELMAFFYFDLFMYMFSLDRSLPIFEMCQVLIVSHHREIPSCVRFADLFKSGFAENDGK